MRGVRCCRWSPTRRSWAGCSTRSPRGLPIATVATRASSRPARAPATAPRWCSSRWSIASRRPRTRTRSPRRRSAHPRARPAPPAGAGARRSRPPPPPDPRQRPRRKRMSGSARVCATPPGPRGYPLLGVFPKARRDPLGFFLDAARTFGDVVILPFGVRRLYLLSHPDHIRYVLQEDERHFLKSPAAERIRPLFGKSLTTVDGEDWRRRRHLMRPVFTPQRMAALVPIIVETTDAMLQRWRGRVATGLAFDVFDEMTELTRSIMLRVLFGVVSYEEAREVGRAVTIVAERVNRGLWSALGWLPRLRIARQER